MQKQDSPEQVEDHGTPKKGVHEEEVMKSAEKIPKRNLILLRKKLEENRYVGCDTL
jgi:hypothetical protein